MSVEYFNIEYALVLMAGVILYLLYYMYDKDSQYSKNIHSVATVVEELNREIFFLKKSMVESQKTLQSKSKSMSDDEIYAEIERTVYDMVRPLSAGLKQMQQEISSIDTQIESRVASIESGIKEFSLPASINANDDEKIISLYQQGISLATISKELHLSQSEVEFILKINKIK